MAGNSANGSSMAQNGSAKSSSGTNRTKVGEYPAALQQFLKPIPGGSSCPSSCPTRNFPPPRQYQSTPQLRAALTSTLTSSILETAFVLPDIRPEYFRKIEYAILELVQRASNEQKSTQFLEMLEDAGVKDYCRKVIAGEVSSDDGTIVTSLICSSFRDMLDVLVSMWNHSTKSADPCLHAFDNLWKKLDWPAQVKKHNSHKTDMNKRELAKLERKFPPIDRVLEEVQCLVATRKLRGKPWNRPKECRETLIEGRKRLNDVLLLVYQDFMKGKLEPIIHFFEKGPDPVTFFVNVIRNDHQRPSGPYLDTSAKPWSDDPIIEQQVEDIVSYFLYDSHWAKVVQGKEPSPLSANSPDLPSSPTKPLNNSTTSQTTSRKVSPASLPTTSSAKTQLNSNSSTSTNPNPKNSKAKAAAPPPSSTPKNGLSTSAQSKLRDLQREQARIEKEIASMESQVERMRKSRRSTDRDLWAGEFADGRWPGAPVLHLGMPSDPNHVTPHPNPYLKHLPHFDPVQVCPPHLHLRDPDFNYTALDPLDYALTSIFASSLTLEIHQAEGPLVLESIRDVALDIIFKQKIHSKWDPSSAEARNIINKVLKGILEPHSLYRLASNQPIGVNALPEALIKARIQIQQAINFESPRDDPFSEWGSPCVCELTNHVPAINLLNLRLSRAATVQGELQMRHGGPIDKERIFEVVRARSNSLGPKWQNDQLEETVSLTLKTFEAQWDLVLSQSQTSLNLLWDCTLQLVKWIGGVRLWEEARKMIISQDESSSEVSARLSPYKLVTSYLMDVGTKQGRNTGSVQDMAKFKTKADAAMKDQKYEEALDHYDFLILLMAPTHVAARTNAALALIKRGRTDTEVDAELAVSHCTAALAYDPRSVKALYRRALAYQKLQLDDMAMNDLEEALNYEPNLKEVKAELERLRKKLEDEVEESSEEE